MAESRRNELKTRVALLGLILYDGVQCAHSLAVNNARPSPRSYTTPSQPTINNNAALASNVMSRRDVFADSATKTLAATVGCWSAATATWHPMAALAADARAVGATPFPDLVSQIRQARQQLDKIPPFIEQEKWDSVRAVLLEKPLADCWAKTSRPLLGTYAEALGEAGGDELAALEAKEELVSHLRYLDMAVYNNNFNPITVEGKSGASKELIQSYYEDPINELKASKQALEELIALSKDIQ